MRLPRLSCRDRGTDLVAQNSVGNGGNSREERLKIPRREVDIGDSI
jgi:hypothetical protein